LLHVEVIGRLSDPLADRVAPAAAEKIRGLGAEPAPSSADNFAQFIRSESAKWGKLIADAGITGE
jgi:tripartite-type tricarboxylate transporter receptor subunit TctC